MFLTIFVFLMITVSRCVAGKLISQHKFLLLLDKYIMNYELELAKKLQTWIRHGD